MGVGDSLQFSHPVLWVPHRQKPSLIVLVETKLKETDKSLRKLSLCQNSCKTLKPLRVMTVLLHWSRALCYIATSDSILGMQQVAYFMNFLFIYVRLSQTANGFNTAVSQDFKSAKRLPYSCFLCWSCKMKCLLWRTQTLRGIKRQCYREPWKISIPQAPIHLGNRWLHTICLPM